MGLVVNEMTGIEREQQLRRAGGEPWERYKTAKRRYIADVVEAAYRAGERVSRKQAQEWWFQGLDKEEWL